MKLLVWLLCIGAVVATGVFTFVMLRYDLALFSAVCLLGAALIVMSTSARDPQEVDNDRFAKLSHRIGKNAKDIENLSQRSKDQAQRLAELVQRTNASAASHREVPRKAMPPQQLNVHQVAQPVLPQPRVEVSPQIPILHLEPVVRLSEGRTAYYKASLQIPGAQGAARPKPVVTCDMAMTGERQWQWDPSLDLNILKQVLPVVGRLRARRGQTGIFTPISRATLDDMAALQAYVAILQSNPDGAAGIVLDLHQSVLAGLGENGMRGLAWLSSLGATFCLTGRVPAHSDIDALTELGFAFLDIPAEEVMYAVPAGLPDPVHELAVVTRSKNIAIIASGVTMPDNQRIIRYSALARGPAYQAPRVVREDAVGQSLSSHVA